MNKIESTYDPFSFVYKHRYVLVFSILLFFVAKPIVLNSIVVDEIKYELFDTSDKENSSESETVTEFEDENTYFYFNDFNVQLDKKHSLSYQLMGLSFLNFNKDIHLPPPRV